MNIYFAAYLQHWFKLPNQSLEERKLVERLGLIIKTRKRFLHTLAAISLVSTCGTLPVNTHAIMHVDLMWAFHSFVCILWMHSYLNCYMYVMEFGWELVTHVRIWGIFAQNGHIIWCHLLMSWSHFSGQWSIYICGERKSFLLDEQLLLLLEH